MTLRVLHTNTQGTCGLGVVYGYNERMYQGLGYQRYTKSILEDITTGTGFFVAGFIDTADCKEAYEVLCSKYKTVYQSPVRVNTNSSNKFFFVIFDTK